MHTRSHGDLVHRMFDHVGLVELVSRYLEGDDQHKFLRSRPASTLRSMAASSVARGNKRKEPMDGGDTAADPILLD